MPLRRQGTCYQMSGTLWNGDEQQGITKNGKSDKGQVGTDLKCHQLPTAK
jgi:hypothetical protein